MTTPIQPTKTFTNWATVSQWFWIRFRTLLSPETPPILRLLVFPHFLRELVSRRRFAEDLVTYAQRCQDLTFSSAWFLNHYGKWRWFIRREGLREKTLKILEIGSWEGMSAHFFLSHLPRAHLTAVDTWMGSEEHSVEPEQLFACFQENVSGFVERLDVRRMSSDDFFESLDMSDPDFQPFDLVHVDGDHSFEQVRRDAESAWRAVRDGGYIVFDDYFWVPIPGSAGNPGEAINGFLREKRGQYRLVDCTYQLLIQKVLPV